MSYAGKEMAEQSESLTPEEEKGELAVLLQQVRELTARNHTLEQLVRKDDLTGLDNRRSFEEEMRREFSRAIRTKQPISVIFADIDDFKNINDQKGHLAGDTSLQFISHKFEQGTRNTDRVCRYGGEEFAIILPDTSLDSAIGISERLRRKIENSTIEYYDKQIKATASFGVSSFMPTGSDTQKPEEDTIKDTISQLINTADQAMYAAKEAGKNRTGFINSEGKISVLEKDPTNHSKMVVRYPKP